MAQEQDGINNAHFYGDGADSGYDKSMRPAPNFLVLSVCLLSSGSYSISNTKNVPPFNRHNNYCFETFSPNDIVCAYCLQLQHNKYKTFLKLD